MQLYATSYAEAIKLIGLETSGIDCDALSNASIPIDVERRAKEWLYDLEKENPLLEMNITSQRCNFLRRYYGFNTYPLSDEERDFPLAYGILVHRQPIQVIPICYTDILREPPLYI
ncbi:unnamed protein product [Toxocara canis]|uniref:DNA-directed DNA polymerase n=1 Tax=Toxocara canis TaxID=6265 RepID=A0A183U6H0_TOXCA|nr:unnamed protein product [Toxocara canis]